MGILNCTPDSFYEGSRKQTEKEIADRANEIISQGATMIDIGAMSTRPGGVFVSEKEEMERLRFAIPIVRREQPDAILSVDTYRPMVARMAVEELEADIINDVSEGKAPADVENGKAFGEEKFRMDKAEAGSPMFREVARLGVPYILMSVQPTMERMLENFTAEVAELRQLGVKDIILDPGYGFGKTLEGNYQILNDQRRLEALGLPLLIGVSRKRMVWQTLGTDASHSLNGTTALHVLALERGGSILRVHDVREAVETIKIVNQL